MASPTKELQTKQFNLSECGLNRNQTNPDTGETIEIPAFANRYNFSKYFQQEGVINDKPSETVPGQSMSIPQMMERYNAGLSVPMSDLEFLENDEPMPDLHDLTDLQVMKEYLDNFEEKVKLAKEKFEEEKKKVEKQQLDLEKEVERIENEEKEKQKKENKDL